MHIEIETTNLTNNNFPNKKREGYQWYTVSQEALLFRSGEKYPDKFTINLYFQSHESAQEGNQAQQSIVAFKAGKYQLEDKAFRIDQRGQLGLDVLCIKPLEASLQKAS